MCWVDDEGLLRTPARPLFQVRTSCYEGDSIMLAGYGLVLASNDSGESVSVPSGYPFDLSFESWELRISPDTFTEEIMRIPEQEFKTTDCIFYGPCPGKKTIIR